jgi:hypothetical protein
MKIFNFTDIEGRDSVSAMNPIYTYGHDFSRHMAQGLADNWSQVSKRYSSTSVAEYDECCILSFYMHMQHRYGNEIMCGGIRCPWLPLLQIRQAKLKTAYHMQQLMLCKQIPEPSSSADI